MTHDNFVQTYKSLMGHEPLTIGATVPPVKVSAGSQMEHTRKVLETIIKAGHVSPAEMSAALAEVDQAEAMIGGRILDGLLCIGNPEKTPEDEAIKLLGDTFMVLQTFMMEMRKRQAFKHVQGYVADGLIAARKYLVAHGYEPLLMKNNDSMSFKPVVFEKDKDKK